MPTDNGNPEPNQDASANQPSGPGERRMQPSSIVLVALYLVIASVAVLYGLIKLWPYPTPGGTEGDQTTSTPAAGQQGTTTPQTAPNSQGQIPPSSNPGSVPQNQPGNAQTTSSQPAGSTQNAPVTSQPGSGQPTNSQSAATQAGQPQSSSSGSQSGGSQTASGRSPCPAAPTPAPKPGGTPKKVLPDPECISFLGSKEVPIYLETRLLLLVMLAGALGSLMHALRSLYWYTGNRMMVWSWVAFYLLLPVTGAILAVIFYFVVRGGFFSPQSSFDNTSPFGFAALAALVGLFSPQATLKLKEIAETIFSKPGAGTDNKPQESSQAPTKPAPTISSLDRTSGVANDSVVINGTGFSAPVTVKFGDVSAVVSTLSDTSITVVVPENPSATGEVDVVVTADGKSAPPQKFTYAAGGTSDTTDELEGDDEIKSNTTDEELPITEGGVE